MQAMPYEKIKEFFYCIGMIQAQEAGVSVHVSAFPHMKEAGRKKYMSLIQKESTRYLNKPKRSVLDAALELAKKMGGYG